jgi:hypothetical protein
MKQYLFSIFFFHLISTSIIGQKVVDTQRDLAKYPKLGKDEKVYYIEKDNIQIDSLSVISMNTSLIIGKCNDWDEMSCGIINLSVSVENIARMKGYNGVSINNYQGTERKDTLDVIFYRLTSKKIIDIQKSDTLKQLYLINPKSNTDKDTKIDGEKLTVKSGSFLKKAVNSDYVTVKLGGGLLSSSGQLGFTKSNKRYFVINGYQITGATTGVGIGVSSPTLMEVGEVAAKIIMKYLPNN